MCDELREIAPEAVSQTSCGMVVCMAVGPGRAWIEDLRVDTFDLDRNLETEMSNWS